MTSSQICSEESWEAEKKKTKKTTWPENIMYKSTMNIHKVSCHKKYIPYLNTIYEYRGEGANFFKKCLLG